MYPAPRTVCSSGLSKPLSILPRNRDTVTLKREPWTLPESVPFGDATLKPLRGGETLNWKMT